MHDGKITPGDVASLTTHPDGQVRLTNGMSATKFRIVLVDEHQARRVYVDVTNGEGGTPYIIVQGENRYLDPHMQHRLLTFPERNT